MFQAINLFVALVVALSSLICNLPSRQSPSDEPQLRLRADLVLVDVLPMQKKTGRIIGDLNKGDFTVYEDGVKQAISHFSKDKLPVSVILLVDRAGCVNAFNEKIRAATTEAISHLKPEDEIAIMTFSNKVSLFQPFTRSKVNRGQDRLGRAPASQRAALFQPGHLRSIRLHEEGRQPRRSPRDHSPDEPGSEHRFL
jgi:hypothetical protein